MKHFGLPQIQNTSSHVVYSLYETRRRHNENYNYLILDLVRAIVENLPLRYCIEPV